MTAYPAWTPASRPGIIPLHPLTFGTILGRSFSALRQNPRVLLGFALCVQLVAYLVLIVVAGAVAWATFSRLDTLAPGSDDYQTVLIGSIATTAIVGGLLGLAIGALTTIVQGVVVTEVAHAAVAERLPLKAIWQQVKPVAWRLVGYAFLVVFAFAAVMVIVGLAVVALTAAAPIVGILFAILAVLAFVPLLLWLSTKLFVVPAVLILERSTLLGAFARSWRLTRGRFWPILGLIVVLSLVFSALAQVVSIPFTILSAGLGTIISPTGDASVAGTIALLGTLVVSQGVTLLIQAVALVVQSTAAGLVYIDCRMRREGLDLDLLAYVEQRDAGVAGLADPYAAHIGREIAPRFAPVAAPPGYPAPGGYGPPPGYAPQPGYGPPVHGATPYQPVRPTYTAPPPAAAPAPAAPAAAPPTVPAPEPAPTTWAAPGSPSDGRDRESPWA